MANLYPPSYFPIARPSRRAALGKALRWGFIGFFAAFTFYYVLLITVADELPMYTASACALMAVIFAVLLIPLVYHTERSQLTRGDVRAGQVRLMQSLIRSYPNEARQTLEGENHAP